MQWVWGRGGLKLASYERALAAFSLEYGVCVNVFTKGLPPS